MPNKGLDKLPDVVMSRTKTISAARGEDCVAACHTLGPDFHCQLEALGAINDCAHLEKAFPCKSCDRSKGSDQPAYINETAANTPGVCVYTSDPTYFGCEGRHADTHRLCPCLHVNDEQGSFSYFDER
jgi:hypothetical protein